MRPIRIKTAEEKEAVNKRKLNKQAAFDNYKRKNYLEGYRFFISHGYSDRLYVSNNVKENEENAARGLNEIKAPHTLVKYVKLAKEGKLKIKIDYQELTFNELKENILIERLAGLLG
jgi:hypothetical protein